MGKDCQYMRKALLVQYQRLLDWRDVAGFLEGEGQGQRIGIILDGKQTLLVAILSEIKTMMDDFALLNGRYEELQSGDNLNKEAEDVDVVAEIKALNFKSRTTPTQNRYQRTIAHFKSGVKNLKDISMHPKRLRWVTFDGEEFKKLLSRLGEMVNYLHELLSDHDSKVLLETTKNSYMKIIEVHKSADRIEHLIQALILTGLDDAVTLTASQDSLKGQRENDRASTRIARFKALSANLGSKDYEGDRKATELDANDIRYDDANAATGVRRLDATYRKDRQVWIEWKRYTTYLVDQAQNTWAMHEETKARIQKLAVLLKNDGKPDEFCTVNCLGYFDNRKTDRFAEPDVGLVYEKPDHCKAGTVPVSLLDLLTRADYTKPSLTARADLAHRLASCLGYLHVVNWLHKGFRSDNVVMLPDETGNLDIRKSRLSGFEYSRPDISGASTSIPPVHAEWEIYRHPDYQGMKPQPARKTYDIYSLGIVLIEIALWQSIGTIMKKDYAGDLRAIKAVKNELLDTKPEYLEQVRSSAGDRYHKVVLRCLQGSQGFDIEFDDVETSLDASAKLQRQYTEYVVHELRGITETL
jgi:hypothetical protein